MTTATPDLHTYLNASLGAHAAYKLHYHLVWSVTGRRQLLVGPVADRLSVIVQNVTSSIGVTLVTLHVEPEHVHLLVSLRPDLPIATVVARLKGVSSRLLRQEFDTVREAHQHALWNAGYFARTLGDINVAQAKAYLDRQREHHGG